jgi:hypothetical protein
MSGVQRTPKQVLSRVQALPIGLCQREVEVPGSTLARKQLPHVCARLHDLAVVCHLSARQVSVVIFGTNLLYLSGDAAERRHRTGRERKGAHTPGRRFKIQSCCCLGCAFDGRTLLASSTLQGKVDDNAGVILSGVGHVASIAARSRRCKSWSATAFPPLRHGLVATVHHTAGAGVGSCPSCSPKSGRGPRTWFSRLNTGERESSPLPGMTAGMGNRPPLYSWNCRANVYVCVHSADSLRGHQHPPYQSVQTKPPRLALAVAML